MNEFLIKKKTIFLSPSSQFDHIPHFDKLKKKVKCDGLFFLVTVADYADADPAVVKSGRVKKAVVNAVAKEGKFMAVLVSLCLCCQKTVPSVKSIILFQLFTH